MNVKRVIILLIILLLIVSCGKRQTVLYDQPEVVSENFYETVWVNPTMVYSDSLYSLIKAKRLDSILVDKTGEVSKEINSVTFFIPMANCFTKINMINSKGDNIYPLFADDLSMGYYKLTYNSIRIDSSLYNDTDLLIKINYCAKSVMHNLNF